MLPRERVRRAIDFRAPDKLPLRIFPAPGGVYQYGARLLDLIRGTGHDFGDLAQATYDTIVRDPPTANEFDCEGRYHTRKTDEWGTLWEYRIYGIWGHPVEWPLEDFARLDSYRPPAPPILLGDELRREVVRSAAHRERYYLLRPGGSLFERMHSLRRFELVLMDIGTDAPEINRLADMIVENMRGWVEFALASGTDGVTFGDDFGMHSRMMISPSAWRRFFKPRYKLLFDPVRQAGKRVFFHCCGWIEPILEDLREIGVDVLWPQLSVYNLPNLARHCRALGLALELHPDRGDLMQRHGAEQVRLYLQRLVETFRCEQGGSWLYVEVDPGFAAANIEMLFRTVQEMRA